MEGQGNITYGNKNAAGGGSGGLAIVAANNGLSLKADGAGFDVVLGNDVPDVTYPARLLNDRQVPMNNFAIRWLFKETDPAYIGLNHGEAPIFFDYLGSVLTGGRWLWFWPANYGTIYAGHGVQGEFGTGYNSYPGVNLPATPRPNVVALVWGYNTEFSMGPLQPGEAAFRFATEDYFMIGADSYFEFHWPEMTTEGNTIFRTHSMYMDRINYTGSFWESVIDDWAIFDTGHNPAGGQFYYQLQYNPTADVALLKIASMNAGGVTEFVMGNYVDPSCFMTAQSGLFNINAPVDIDLRSARVIMDSTNYGNIVNPTISSDTNTDTPLGDEMFGIQSTTKGFRLPAMTTAQRLAMAPVGVGGLLVFDSTIGKAYIWTGAAWEQVQSV